MLSINKNMTFLLLAVLQTRAITKHFNLSY